MADRPQFNLSNYLPYLMNRAGMKVAARFTAEALARENLSIDMYRVLAALSHGGEQRQIDLSGLTSIEASTMSRLVTRLVAMSLVIRQRSKTSSREVVVALSAKGNALMQRLIPLAYELERLAVAGIPAKDVAVLKRLLAQVYQNLSRER